MPSVPAQYSNFGLMEESAHGSHCAGPQSYGTTFEVLTYDNNIHLFPLIFAHFNGPERYESGRSVFY